MQYRLFSFFPTIIAVVLVVGVMECRADDPELNQHGRGEAPPVPFVVVHADPVINRLFTEMLQNTSVLWAYDEMLRWRPSHAEAMWNFESCGRTQGRWPTCGSSAFRGYADPFDRRSIMEERRRAKVELSKHHQHHRRERVEDLSVDPVPEAVGFSLDLNVMNYHYTDIEQALVKHRVTVVVLNSPFAITETLMRSAIYGSLNVHSRTTPGAIAGVGRSAYGWPAQQLQSAFPAPDHRDGDRHEAVLRSARNDNNQMLHGEQPLVCMDGEPEAFLRILRKVKLEQERLEELADVLREHGSSVYRIDVDRELMCDPRKTLEEMGKRLGATGTIDADPESLKDRIRSIRPRLEHSTQCFPLLKNSAEHLIESMETVPSDHDLYWDIRRNFLTEQDYHCNLSTPRLPSDK